MKNISGFNMRRLIPILLFLIFIISKIAGFTPNFRTAQTSIVVGTKLYYAGGFVNNSVNSNEIFYLDLSSSFQTSSPPWVSLAGKNIPISPDYSTSILSPTDNSTIYLIGGYMVNPITYTPSFNAVVYTFDTNGLRWNTPSTSGSAPIGRQEMSAVVDRTGKVYIFGGCVITNYTTFAADYYNDINILDISINAWTNIQATLSSPSPRSDYTATLLSNGVIVYIGGLEYNSVSRNTTIIDLKKLQLFNTTSLSWSSMGATGVDIQARQYHTAVLSKNGQIIIYGGEDASSRSVTPNLVVLDTTVKPYNWYIPNIPTGKNDPPPLSEHSATMYEDCMIVAFGFLSNSKGTSTTLNTQLYILNTTSYSWVGTFTASPKPSTSSIPSATSTATSPSSSGSEQKSVAIALGVSLGFLGLISIGTVVFCLMRRKRSDVEVLRISSGNGED